MSIPITHNQKTNGKGDDDDDDDDILFTLSNNI